MRAHLALIALLLAGGPALAEEGGEIDGVVTDKATGAPVLGATVVVTGGARQLLALTDEGGRYALVKLPPGTYGVVVSYADAKVEHDHVVVTAGQATNLADRLDVSGEVITIKEAAPPAAPPVPPRPTYESATRPLPYTDEAVVHDVWGLAWLLLEVDTSGRVIGFKFLRRPGHGLDEVATREAFKLRFTPAADSAGRPVVSRVLWKMEWESYSRKVAFGNTATNRQAPGTPTCAGAGPLSLNSVAPVYRDCSKPDYKLAARGPWIHPPGSGAPAEPPSAPVAADRASALKAYSRDCDDKVAEGCFDLSILYETGDGVARIRRAPATSSSAPATWRGGRRA